MNSRSLPVHSKGPLEVSFGIRCELGYKRVENQDHVGNFISPLGQVFVLADGMGGHKGGSVASRLAITGFERHFLSQREIPLQEALLEAARLVNTDVFEQGHGDNAETRGMGSTLVVALFQDDVVTVGHIGDSRCYLYSKGNLRVVTHDHSAVQFMVDAGVLTPEQARNHPDSSVLTRALGQKPEIELDLAEPVIVADNDVFLMCSDGLHGYVRQAAIEGVLRSIPDPQAAADLLIELALAAGGHDNISVMVIRAHCVPETPVPQPKSFASMVPIQQALEQAGGSQRKNLWLAGALLATLALAVGGSLSSHLRNAALPEAAMPVAAAVASSIAATPAAAVPVPATPVPATPAIPVTLTNPPKTAVRVIIIAPSDTDPRYMQTVLETEKKLQDDGFLVSHNRKPVRDGLVWRMVLPRNAVSAPGQPLVSAVYLPGSQDEAARICFLAHCSSSTPAMVDDRDLSMFKENCPRRTIALFMHPGRKIKAE